MAKIRRPRLSVCTDRLPLHLLIMERFAFCYSTGFSVAFLGHVLLELPKVRTMCNALNANVKEVSGIEIKLVSETCVNVLCLKTVKSSGRFCKTRMLFNYLIYLKTEGKQIL